MVIKQNTVVEIVSFLLILLFVYAAMSKLLDYDNFQRQISRSPLLSSFSKAAWLLPVTELITAVSLCIKPLRITGLIFSFWLMLAFTLYISGMLLFNKNLPCTCGGVLKQLSWKQHLLFNFFFFLFVTFFACPKKVTKKRTPKKITSLFRDGSLIKRLCYCSFNIIWVLWHTCKVDNIFGNW
jgi:hypothetical protein